MDSDLDPFDDPRLGNPWLRYATLCLNFVGVIYLLLGLIGGPAYAWVFIQSGEVPLPLAIVIGLFLFLAGVGFGIGNFVAAALLGRGSKIGWVLGLILGAMYTPSGCLPFGVIILIGVLNEKSRKRFLG